MADIWYEGESGGQNENGLTRIKRWTVRGYTNAYQLLSDANLPKRGNSDLPSHPNSICVDVRFDFIPKSINAWTYEAEFQDIVFVPPNGTPTTGDTAPEVNIDIHTIDIWRSNPLMPNNISNPDPVADAVGVARDVGGEPVSHPLPIKRITIPQRVQTFNETFFDTFVLKRNSSTFYGNAAGKVLYLGYAYGQPDGDGFKRALHSFAVDPWFHLRQLPRQGDRGEVVTQAFGQPKYNTSTIIDDGQAYHVRWRQPFPDTANFSAMGLGGGGAP